MTSRGLSRLFATTLFVALGMITTPVLAQNNPEQGDSTWTEPNSNSGSNNGGWNRGDDEEERPTRSRRRRVEEEEDEAPARPATASTGWEGDHDHLKVIHRAGFGYFGTLTAPAGMDATSTMVDAQNRPITVPGESYDLSAPTIGVRYWFSNLIGLEVALGLNVSTGSTADDSSTTDKPLYWGMGIHAGLPLSLANWKHFAFVVTPFLNMAFGGGTIYGSNADYDKLLSAFRLEVGARVGAEIHFGFIGIPQLALQGSVGLGLGYETRTADVGRGPGMSSGVVTTSDVSFATSVQGKPWDIFLGNISAIYYL